jgi:hypothetical protein
MAEPKIGIRAAARLAGTKHPVNLYVAVARKQLKADVVDGQLMFKPAEVQRWRTAVVTERAISETKARRRNTMMPKSNTC